MKNLLKNIYNFFFILPRKEIDYLNPDSPKYYKGYRYKTDIKNDEHWYDKNNVRRKSVFYEGGRKNTEEYYDENEKLHNVDGPARIDSFHNYKEYWLNGKRLTEKEWYDKTNKDYWESKRIVNQNDCILHYNITGRNIEKHSFYRDGGISKIGFGGLLR